MFPGVFWKMHILFHVLTEAVHQKQHPVSPEARLIYPVPLGLRGVEQ